MMRRSNLFALAAAMSVFAALFAVCKMMLAGAAFIEVVVQLDHRDRLQIFYSGIGSFSEQHAVFSSMIEPGQPQTVRIKLGHVPVKRLRLDVGEIPGTVRLYKMTAAGLFAAEQTELQPAELFRRFSVHAADTAVRLEPDHVAVQTHKDSWLACETPLLRPPPLLLWGIPLLFALLAFAVVQQTDFASLPPFADLRNKQPSTGTNINALDGLRGLAIVMVVADHTWGWFSGVGRSGVWIFMTLSGFLLAQPFVRQPERILSLSVMRHFFLRRMQRILPVYYSYITVVLLFYGRFDDAVLHVLFLKGSSHLWVVPQEVVFYLLTPPVMLLCLLLFRMRPWLVPPALLVLIILSNHFSSTITLYGGMNEHIPLYFGIFLSGVLAAWIHASLWQHITPAFRQQAEPWAAVLAVLILLLFILFSHEREWGGNRFFALLYFPWFGAAAAVLILAALAAGQSFLIRFLSWLPLRALSLVSFSVYIFHTIILDIVRKSAAYYCSKTLSGPQLFVCTLLLSYLFACITYSLIERPFLRPA